MFKVSVPASTANLGSGFDCMGIALKLYNVAEFEETDGGVEINILDDTRAFLPSDENNFIYKTMEYVFNKAGRRPKGVKINIDSHIPVTRGLGSSSASLAIGLAGANELIGSPFTREQLLEMACELEGHPDNVTPAFCGGFTVSVMDGKKLFYTKTEIPETIRFGAMIPDFYLATRKARGVLPKKTFHKNAVYNLAHAAYFASAISKGDFSAFSVGAKDKLHQRYRFGIIKNSYDLINLSRKSGAVATFLSGAGPTIISVVDKNYAEYEYKMNQRLKNGLSCWKLTMLEADNEGMKIIK